jgi:transcriptional regulator with XRE-family HTH domain
MNDRMRVAARVRQLRERAGYTLLQMEALTGLSLSTLRAVEQAGRVSPRTAERLAAVLKVEAAGLITRPPPGVWA